MQRIPIALAVTASITSCDGTEPPRRDVLAYSRTAGFRHESAIVAARDVLPAELEARGLTVDLTEDPLQFDDATLTRYRAVCFLYTTLDVLDDTQQAALERFVRGGGGFIGVHSAADTEYDWPFYQQLIVAPFASHPAIQPAIVDVVDRTHPATLALPVGRWSSTDEWYNFARSPRAPDVQVLLAVDETTYTGGTMGADHPLAWAHERLNGRMFYTALGHDGARWREPDFVAHVLGGVTWALRPLPE